MMMYEKNAFIVCVICLLLFILTGCCTGAAVYGNGDGAYQVREHIGELEDKQTESAVTGERLNGTLENAREQSEELNREIAKGREYSEHLKQSITDGARHLEEFASILQRIRKRGSPENGGDANSDR